MRRFTLSALLYGGCCAVTLSAAQVQTFEPTYTTARRATLADSSPARAASVSSPRTASAETDNRFIFRDPSGKVTAAPIVPGYLPGKVLYPLAKADPRLSPSLMRAASIAQERAYAHSKSRCWHYVKEALLAAGAVSSRPKSEYAKDAGDELVASFGFRRLPIRDPFAAPIGAVLVYGSRRAAGHVEIRTKTGFVSDFRSPKPSKRPLLGVYAKA
ncbi:MAG: hypothetical protein M3Y69_09130 [Verrucomicrobiota bacterium]|nr:hypothetical protein [Verrucomicrobiota bacterium]